jgi:hypothetical protein
MILQEKGIAYKKGIAKVDVECVYVPRYVDRLLCGNQR